MKLLHTTLALLILFNSGAQVIRSKTDKVLIDLTDSKNEKNSSFPKIVWTSPKNETIFQKELKANLNFTVYSKSVLKNITLNSYKVDGEIRKTLLSKVINPKESEKHEIAIDQNVVFSEGVNEIEIVVENMEGIRAYGQRIFHIGETALADASKLNRKDYALIIVTDKYDNWPELVNPVFDGNTIRRELEEAYGFNTEIIENPSQEAIWAKLREYAEKKYQPLDQLFIFFAGHGHYDDTFKEGYIVTKESLPNDASNSSYVSHNRLRSNINNIPCEHILLVMDVCFSGTFDEAIASARSVESIYKDVSQSEFITRKLAYKTRKYLTSGGKEYVSDGVKGKHSPFASKFIDALKTKGGNDGILSLNELLSGIEKNVPEPKFGKFGNDAPGSEFVFVVK